MSPSLPLSRQQVAGAPENSPRGRRSSVSSEGSATSGKSEALAASGKRRPSVTSISSLSTTLSGESWPLRDTQYAPLGKVYMGPVALDEPPQIRNVLVRIKGRDPLRQPLRVALDVELTTVEHGAQLLVDKRSRLPFPAYVAQEINENVTALYYRIRSEKRAAGEESTKLVQFSGRGNPFFPGMELIACIDSDTPPVDERSSSDGCSVM